MKHLGWIFDLYHRDGQMVVWLKKADGSLVRLVDEWEPRIRVRGELRDLVDLASKPYVPNSRLVDRFEKPGLKEKSPTLEIRVASDREATRLARIIQRVGYDTKFRLYDVDVPSPQMYLYLHDLFPLALVEAEDAPSREAEDAPDGVKWSLRDSRESLTYSLPPLRIVKLRLETKTAGRIRSLNDELGTVRILREDGDDITIDSGGEAEKLLNFVEAFRGVDPDIVLTQGGDSFIFPFLARRAQEHGILDRIVLGRDPTPLRVYEVQGHSYFSYGKVLYRQTAARLAGRLHIDESNAFITSDCGLEGLFEVSRTCIIPLQRASHATIGTSMTSLQLYAAVKNDILIPWNKSEPEEWKTGAELIVADRGGFIYEPQVGIFDEVGELDFSSLYPSLMLKENLSGETVPCKCCPTSTSRVPELGYRICQRWQGIVPRSLDILLRKRALYKKFKKEAADPPTREVFDQRQAALKWILVCS